MREVYSSVLGIWWQFEKLQEELDEKEVRELKRLDDRKRNYQDEYLSWLKQSQREKDNIVETD